MTPGGLVFLRRTPGSAPVRGAMEECDMKKIVMGLAIAVAAGAAQAKEVTNSAVLAGYNPNGGGSGLVSSFLNIDPSGILSYDLYGDTTPGNVVAGYNIGANSHVIGIGWDVDLYADSPSWLSELTVAFEDSAQTTGVFLAPGAGDNFSGASTYSSGGVVDLVGLVLDFNVGPDGILRLEYFEGYDDYLDDWDGIWEGGTLTVEYVAVPAPGAAALFGAGGLIALRRRR